MRKNRISMVILILILILVLSLLVAATPAQGDAPLCTDVVVQTGDTLSRLAEKYFGDMMAYPLIVEATNEASRADDSYAEISEPDVIEPGWKLCVPDRGEPEEPAPVRVDRTIYLEIIWRIVSEGADGDVSACERKFVRDAVRGRTLFSSDCIESEGESAVPVPPVIGPLGPQS